MLMSHLLQMRGLKLLELVDAKSAPLVASFTDAWIETETWSRTANLDAVASFTDAWIETAHQYLFLHPDFTSHLLQMRGLKRVLASAEYIEGFCRIFYRCVD